MSRTDPVPPPHPRAPAWAVDIALGVLVILPAFVPFLPPELRPDSVTSWLTALAPAVILPLRRRWPLSALVALMMLSAIAAVSGALYPGVGVGVAAAVFHVANTMTRRRALQITIVVIIVMAGVAVLGSVLHGLDPLVFQLVVFVSFAAAAGDAARSRREYLVAVTERAERAELTRESEARRRVTEERLRIARDLHDAVAHQISVISLNAGVASASLDANPERTRTALRTIREASRTVLGEIGDMLSMLRADAGEAASTAPQYGLAHLDALLDQFTAGGLEVRCRIEGNLSRVTGAVDLVAYRVIQEALTNVHKHGSAHRAHLLIDVGGDTLRIVVTNPYAATPAGGDATGSGLGILGVRERVASVRGTVEAGPSAGEWKFAATMPIAGEDRV